MFDGLISGNYFDIALLILRVGLGIIFIAHGFSKIRNLANTREQFLQMGVPAPLITSSYAAFIEFFGGILLVLGFYSQWASLGIAIDMLGAMLFVKFKSPFIGGWELDVALFIMATAVFLLGPGAIVFSFIR